MRLGTAILCLIVIVGAATPALAQQDRPWWGAFDLGGSGIKLRSDQQQSNRATTLALGFTGGHRITSRARAGLKIHGWLLQSANFFDPTRGESVSNFNGIVDVFPIRNKPLFLRGGGGLSTYSINRSPGSGGHGPDWELGGGYEFRMGSMGIAPIIQYSTGQLGTGFAPSAAGTGLRYSVIEFKVAYIFRFGREKQ